MAVVIETTIGDITIDLLTEERPRTCLNFLKLCKMKYYNSHLFYSVEQNFIAQTGDPTASGRGGASVFQKMYGDQARFYEGEKLPILKHNQLGTISMVSCGSHLFGSQFFITLGENLDSLDGEHLIFGEVVEGLEVINKLNQTLCDDNNRPYQDVRITHTVVLEDPYPDPDKLEFPDESPKLSKDVFESDYIAADEIIDDTEGKSMEELHEEIAAREAKARTTILEMVGDLPDSDVAPPENVLFVCKLNPVTTSEDLEIIFSRFGKIVSCEVICDQVSKNSLQYAFIEFAEPKSCEDAYFKMDNVLIDDRRVHVDFSQSVSKIQWKGKGRGVEVFDDSGKKMKGSKAQNFNPNRDVSRDGKPRGKNMDRGQQQDNARDRDGRGQPQDNARDRDGRGQPQDRDRDGRGRPRHDNNWERDRRPYQRPDQSERNGSQSHSRDRRDDRNFHNRHDNNTYQDRQENVRNEPSKKRPAERDERDESDDEGNEDEPSREMMIKSLKKSLKKKSKRESSESDSSSNVEEKKKKKKKKKKKHKASSGEHSDSDSEPRKKSKKSKKNKKKKKKKKKKDSSSSDSD